MSLQIQIPLSPKKKKKKGKQNRKWHLKRLLGGRNCFELQPQISRELKYMHEVHFVERGNQKTLHSFAHFCGDLSSSQKSTLSVAGYVARIFSFPSYPILFWTCCPRNLRQHLHQQKCLCAELPLDERQRRLAKAYHQ